MKNWARQQKDEEEVFDLVGVSEAEGWDQTELMFFVFENGAEKGVQFCREYYDEKTPGRRFDRRSVLSQQKRQRFGFSSGSQAGWGCKWLMVV